MNINFSHYLRKLRKLSRVSQRILISTIVGSTLLPSTASFASSIKSVTTNSSKGASALLKGGVLSISQQNSRRSFSSHTLTANEESESPLLVAQESTPEATEEPTENIEQFLLPTIPLERFRPAAGSPGSTSSSPSAFGASQGQGFVGVSTVSRNRFTNNELDGAFSVGAGLGNPREIVGLETVFSLNSLSGDDIGESSVSFKLHRLLPENIGIAFGVENAIIFGENDAGRSFYGVVSKVFQLKDSPRKPFSSLTASVGLGSGRFRPVERAPGGVLDVPRDTPVGVFGSVGLRVIEQAGVTADWNGQDLSLAVSVAPFRRIPLVLTPAVADITGSAGDGPRFTFGAGYAFTF